MYWKAPYFLKNWLASLNARKLDFSRYGLAYERIVSEIAEHDRWSPEKFIEYQRQELHSLIRHAGKNVPYYRRMFAEAGIAPSEICQLQELPRLPILEKQIVRSSPKVLVDETLDQRRLLVFHTSGTTGTPLTLYRDVKLCSAIFAFLDARWHQVADMSRRANKSVSIGGYLVAAPERTKPPFWVYNRRWKQLYMSSYHLSPKYLGYYVDELRQFRADYIEGYPSSVHAIAQYIFDNELDPVPFKACYTTAENLFDHQREAIEKAFGCRTYNQYGCGEQVVFAAECEHGSLHLSPEIGIVEIVDEDDRPLPVGETGQLICTSLINRVQPFIRYRVGDMAALRDGLCSCGSPLPLLGHVEGRTDAVLITRDGRKIGRLDPLFKGVHGIAEAQIVQTAYDQFVIRIVPGKEYTDTDGQHVATNLSHRVGKADIRVRIVDHIERTKAGKFRAVVCKLDGKHR